MTARRSPTVRRRRIAIELRRLRTEAGLTIDDAGRLIGKTGATISRIEKSQVGVKQEDLTRLLDGYGVADPLRETLLTIAKDARQKGWWHTYGKVLPEWFEVYLGLESEASSIRTYQVKVVHGLLQTEGYARALLGVTQRFDRADEIKRQVSLRMKRQEVLAGDNPTELTVVLDETVLRRPVGGREVMRAQLEHLLKVGALPNVEIQVLPYAAGAHMGFSGAFNLLKFPGEPPDPAVVYLEHLGGSLYLDEPDDIERYERAFTYLQMVARSPAESAEIIAAIVKED